MQLEIKAILFDVGGTLRFTERVAGRDLQLISKMRDFLQYPDSTEELKSTLTTGEKNYRKWAKKSLVELSEAELWTRFMLPDYCVDFVRQNAVELNQMWRGSKGEKHLLPYTVDTIKELAARGYKLCIISNTTSSIEVPELLRENGIRDLFSSVILSAVYGRRKPHPSLFLDAARDLGVHPQECAYIGDRPSRDVVGARESGFGKVVIIHAKGLKWENSMNIPMQPDHYITQLSELLDIFPPHEKSSIKKPVYRQPEFLYDAALSTMWAIGSEREFSTSFSAGRQMGFARFELNHAVSPDLFSQIDFNQYRIGSVHDPCPAEFSISELRDRDWVISSLDEGCRKKGVEIVLKSIDTALKHGANLVVLHPGQVSGDRSMDRCLRVLYEKGLKGTEEYEILLNLLIQDRKERAQPFMESVIRSLNEIIDYCRPTKLSLGLENRYRYYDIPILDEMETLLDLCSEPWYGFQYDVGHAQTLSQLGLCDHETWLMRYSARIVGTHLHDVKGIADHQSPGLGDVDFRMIAKYLPVYAQRTLEVGNQESQESIVKGMEYLVSCGCIQKI